MRFRVPARQDDEERVLPLINVVFLLLIFFMLAGRLAASDPFRVDPPRSESAAEARARDAIVLVGPDGRLALDGAIVDEADLAARLARRREADPAVAVRLKADAGAEAAGVIEIMELVADAGFQSLTLQTEPARAGAAQ